MEPLDPLDGGMTRKRERERKEIQCLFEGNEKGKVTRITLRKRKYSTETKMEGVVNKYVYVPIRNIGITCSISLSPIVMITHGGMRNHIGQTYCPNRMGWSLRISEGRAHSEDQFHHS